MYNKVDLQMHELSLCENIINSVDDAVTKNNINKNNPIKVNILLGTLAGVDKSSLSFWFPVIAEKMGYHALVLEIMDQVAVGKCVSCDMEYSMESLMDPCSECGSFDRNILSGMAFNIKSLEV